MEFKFSAGAAMWSAASGSCLGLSGLPFHATMKQIARHLIMTLS